MPVKPDTQTSEKEFLRSQYAEIASLAGGLAHEIKNPLSTIGMNLELLAEEVGEGDSPRERRMLQKINVVRKECDHLDDILNAFMQFARAGELVTSPIDLNEVVREFIKFYQPKAETKGIEISPHLATNLPLVNGDKSLLRQVLMNLALNAEQAMQNGGLLEIQTSSLNDIVHLEIIDNGCGMDKETVEKMFEAFFSTRAGGNGLGLPTVRKIIESHQGKIVCESAPGSGTRFTISLNAADAREDENG